MDEIVQRGHVQSLVRGLNVIRAFRSETPQMSLADIARSTDLTRATARRFLQTLEDLGYVRYQQRKFSLTPRVLELGFGYISSLNLPQIAQPHLELLTNATNESTSAGVLDGDHIVQVTGVTTRRIMNVSIVPGTRFPAAATAIGRVLLASLEKTELEQFISGFRGEHFTSRTLTDPDRLRAELAQVAEQGWSIVDQELEEGLRAIAAPVHKNGTVVAAIAVYTTMGSEPFDGAVRRLLDPLLRTAGEISDDFTFIVSAPGLPESHVAR